MLVYTIKIALFRGHVFGLKGELTLTLTISGKAAAAVCQKKKNHDILG